MTPMRVLTILAAAIALMAAAPAARAADWRDQGARSLIITYQVAPADRPAFRAAVRRSTLPRLDGLRSAGELTSYHVLMSRYVDSAGWDMMAILNFRSAEDLAHWRSIETMAPAGLDPQASRLVRGIASAPADPARTGASRSASEEAPVYLVVPYDYLVSTDDYLTYVDGYLLPQVNGWMDAGALGAYGVYLARYYPGRPWSSMLLLEYRGDAGLARRDAVVKAVRASLAASPEWKKIADNKSTVRVEKLAVVADELLPEPAPRLVHKGRRDTPGARSEPGRGRPYLHTP
ncbi:MAG: hypothetical protein JWR47_3608 [Phenylobacterium sp.]|nr:hypothetical protein [Phenylobacterium sp.]